MDTGVYVLGMHRSGTSATTRLIHLLGVPINVESDWVKPAPDNPKGFWESQALVDLNDELLAAIGGDTVTPPDLPRGWETAPRLDGLYARAGAIFPTLFPTEQWVWKDPRTCLTFPFWRRAIAARAVVVIAYRNPLEVARSFETRNDIPVDHALSLWERYVRHSLRGAQGLPTFVTAYDGMMRDPHAWCARIGAFLSAQGVTITPATDLDTEIDAFIDPSLRHSAHSLDDLRAHPEGARTEALVSYLAQIEGAHAEFAPSPGLCAESERTSRVLARLPRRRDLRVVEPRRTSVVVPVFDPEAPLEASLHSIGEQSLPPLEVIVVEGPAALGAGHRARLISGQPTLVVQAGTNRGAIRNTGVTVSRGEYVMMLEAGDQLPADFLARATDLLRDPRSGSVIYADRIVEDGTVVSWPAYDLVELADGNRVGPTAVFHRRAWDDTGGYAPLDALEDWDFWLRCGESGHTGTRLPAAAIRCPRAVALTPGQDAATARIVVNHPRLYTIEQLDWATRVLTGASSDGEHGEVAALAPPRPGAPERWPGRRLRQLRARALLVVAEELRDEPRLAAPLRRIAPTADLTVVLAGGADEAGALMEGLESSLHANGLMGAAGPEMLATALPASVLAQEADAILTFRAPPVPFSGLPQLDPDTLVAWRPTAAAVA